MGEAPGEAAGSLEAELSLDVVSLVESGATPGDPAGELIGEVSLSELSELPDESSGELVDGSEGVDPGS